VFVSHDRYFTRTARRRLTSKDELDDD
jgi:hypothetical protein